VQFASIGPVTSATLRELQMPVTIEAREFTMGGLIRAIVLARYAETPL
jgi:uroporphyrinogen-III synthase